jgi:hypothetical protein
VLVLINALTGVGFWLYGKSQESPKTPKTNDAVVTDLQKAPLTEASLRNVNKDDAFYAYMKRAAQEQKMTITKAYYFSDDGSQKVADVFSKVAVDYRTKKIIYANDKEFSDTGRSRTRCYDGQEYFFVYEWEKEADASSCRQDRLYDQATDGFNAGGLTAAQAETFVSYLRGKPGLITVQEMKVADHGGKKYLHFTVLLQQITVKDTQFAAQWLMFAFQETGLDPFKYPYGYVGSGGQGFKLDYYVDPATGLPAYSEIASLPRVDEAGKNDKSTYHFRIQYDFTRSTFDASPANNTDINLTW